MLSTVLVSAACVTTGFGSLSFVSPLFASVLLPSACNFWTLGSFADCFASATAGGISDCWLPAAAVAGMLAIAVWPGTWLLTWLALLAWPLLLTWPLLLAWTLLVAWPALLARPLRTSAAGILENVLIEMFDEAIDEVLDEVVVEDERIDEIVVVIVCAVGAEATLVKGEAVVAGGSLVDSLLADSLLTASLSAGLLGGCSLGESEEADDISLREALGCFASSSLLDRLPVSDIVPVLLDYANEKLFPSMKNYLSSLIKIGLNLVGDLRPGVVS